MAKSARNSKTFSAALYRAGTKLAWTVIRIPFDVQKVWGTRGRLRVRGELSAGNRVFRFRSALFPDGQGAHFLMVNN